MAEEIDIRLKGDDPLLRELVHLVRDQTRLLHEILARQPRPTYPQPVLAGSRLTVTE